MGFSCLDPADLDWITRPHEAGEPARHVRELSEPVGLTHTRVNIWRYEPGARGKRHRHVSQEETFLVLAGELTMYVGELPQAVRVPTGSLIRVDPRTPLQAANHATGELLVHVTGYPPEDTTAEILEAAV